MSENVMITSKQNFYGTEILIGYSNSSLAFGTFAHAIYTTIEGKVYPTVVLSIPAAFPCSICLNVMAWIIGHEVGHILNGDLENTTPNIYGVMDYEERMSGTILKKEFDADRVGWEICTEVERKGVIREIPYLMLVFKTNLSADYKRVREEFGIRTRAIGFEIGAITREELETFVKKYDTLREEYIRVRGLTA